MQEYFSGFGQIQFYTPPLPPADRLAAADMLLVRTVTRVNARLLQNSRVRFVGTASSGTDHIDCAGLAEHGIKCGNAGGCNSQAVAEYVLSALSMTLARQRREITDLTVGIIGHGRIGSKLASMLRTVGANCLLHDPPLAATDKNTPYVSLQQALRSEVVSIHVPLTTDGTHPTINLINHDLIQALATGTIFINTSRGEVVAEDSLCDRAARGELITIIDVWQNEPRPEPEHIRTAAVATPHIAGYSDNAKCRAVSMLAQQAATVYQLPAVADFKPPYQTDPILCHIPENGTAAIAHATSSVCNPYRDSAFLHELNSYAASKRANLYATARNTWKLRAEFCQQHITTDNKDTARLLGGLGFQVSP